MAGEGLAVKKGVYVRLATKADVPVIKALIEGLAEFENLKHKCEATEASLEATLFTHPAFLGTTVFIMELGPLSDHSQVSKGNLSSGDWEKVQELSPQEIEDPESALFQSTKDETRTVVGYCLFFPNYSTFQAKSGIYLEDLFIREPYRRQGLGTHLLTILAQEAAKRDCGRVTWSVLDWNAKAITFYQKMGAIVLPDWRTCRLTGDALASYLK